MLNRVGLFGRSEILNQKDNYLLFFWFLFYLWGDRVDRERIYTQSFHFLLKTSNPGRLFFQERGGVNNLFHPFLLNSCICDLTLEQVILFFFHDFHNIWGEFVFCQKIFANKFILTLSILF